MKNIISPDTIEFLDQLPAIIWMTDQDLKFTSLSGSALAGIQQKGIRTLEDLFRKKSDQERAREVQLKALSGERVPYEFYWGKRYFQAIIEPLVDANGRITGLAGIALDITQHSETEKKLRSEKDYAFQVIREMGQGVFVLNLQDQIEMANPTLTRMLGYSEGQLSGRPVTDILSSEDLAVVTPRIHPEHPYPCGEEIYLKKSDGSLLFCLVTSRPRFQQGLRAGSISVVTDLTGRIKLEEALRKSEESIRELYDITSSQNLGYSEKIHALLVLGCKNFNLETGELSRLEDDWIVVEKSFSTVTGKHRDVKIPLNQSFSELPLKINGLVSIDQISRTEWANHPACVQHNIQAFLGVPILVSGKVYGTLSFHSQKPHEGSFSVSDQEFMCLMGQWINSELEHEQYLVRLKSYNDEIAQKNEELGVARDQALEVSRLKSEFLATMSHEIRTPMNAVIGMTEILLGTNLSGEQQEYATIVRDSAQVLLTLINDILDFSKIEAGKLVLEKVEFDPVSLVEGAVEMFSTKASQKNLHLMTYVSPRVPELLMGDPVRLRQVLMNLIGNALKFTEHGEVVVRAEMAGSSEQEMLLRFEVKDTGIGLSEVARKRLFQPFTQADGSITRKYGGTGLGLAISKRLVELMGGEIGVESVEHEGSTFWFTVRPGMTSLAESRLQPKMAPDQQLVGSRLMIVDDNQSQREIAQKYLSSLGMRCESASDGETAFSILDEAQKRRDPIQVAILDLDMPGEDGFSLAKRILSSKKLRNTRLILLTAFDQRDQVEKAREIGFSAYLTKPVKQTVLIHTIKQVMTGGEFQAPGRWAQPVDHNAAIQVERLTETIHEPDQSRGLILLAEDHPANQKLAMIQLQKLGFNAEAVSTGAQAVEKILADPERYMLVLMDCQMPELDGFDATRQVRTAEARTRKHTTIIAMTANAMQGDRELCIAAGMDDYLSKPVTLEGLQRVIHEWIEHKHDLHPAYQAASTISVPQIEVAPAQSPLDMEMIEGIRALQEEGEPDLLTDLIDMYLGDSTEQIKQMRLAYRSQDYELLRRTAHTLKGTSGNLGAKELYTLCAEMEKLAKGNLDAEIPSGLKNIEREFERVKEAMLKERKP